MLLFSPHGIPFPCREVAQNRKYKQDRQVLAFHVSTHGDRVQKTVILGWWAHTWGFPPPPLCNNEEYLLLL